MPHVNFHPRLNVDCTCTLHCRITKFDMFEMQDIPAGLLLSGSHISLGGIPGPSLYETLIVEIFRN